MALAGWADLPSQGSSEQPSESKAWAADSIKYQTYKRYSSCLQIETFFKKVIELRKLRVSISGRLRVPYIQQASHWEIASVILDLSGLCYRVVNPSSHLCRGAGRQTSWQVG